MTRFARSKGSKSSNERIPEQATSWEVMHKQLMEQKTEKEDSSKRAEFEAKRKENYDNFLKEEKAKKTTETWCDFPSETKNNKKAEVVEKNLVEKKIKKKKKSRENIKHSDVVDSDKSLDVDDPELSKWCDEYSDAETNERLRKLTTQLGDICDKVLKTKSKKKKKKLNASNVPDEEGPSKVILPGKILPAHTSNDGNSSAQDAKKKKKSKKSSILTVTTEESTENFSNENTKETLTESNQIMNSLKSVNKNKKMKKKHTTSSTNTEESSDNLIANINTTEPMDMPSSSKKSKKKRKLSNTNDPSDQGMEFNPKKKKITNANESNTDKNKSKKKKKDEKEHSRRKPAPEGKNVLIVNGEELDVVTLHGFPITSKDAERIQELRKNLISKGIPRSEVERTIKLERRRAEKTLARLKKNLCFHCRKGGHILSECPELNRDGNQSTMPVAGLCFKCGSTEHTHFACKVVRTQDYKFAQCFICKEQGHISRQCPDNPRGIYPKGGACRVCGDVTHLKKDCPQILQQKEKDTIQLETLQSDNIEDIGHPKPKPTIIAPIIKHVKF